jgi:hypothetical protein
MRFKVEFEPKFNGKYCDPMCKGLVSDGVFPFCVLDINNPDLMEMEDENGIKRCVSCHCLEATWNKL